MGAAELAVCEIVDIIRARGDTKPYSRIIWSDRTGAAQDLTGYGNIVLTVNEVQAPETASSSQLFQITATVVDTSGGEIAFVYTDTEANITPGNYFYDIQMIDPNGKKWTIQKGRYIVEQDITK